MSFKTLNLQPPCAVQSGLFNSLENHGENIVKRTIFAAVLVFISASACTMAADQKLILLTRITPDFRDGDMVQVRETGPNGCTYVGSFHDTTRTVSSWAEKILLSGGIRLTDWSIELARKQCGNVLSQVSAIIPLSKTHTYMDSDGQIRPGYAPRDSVASTKPMQVN